MLGLLGFHWYEFRRIGGRVILWDRWCYTQVHSFQLKWFMVFFFLFKPMKRLPRGVVVENSQREHLFLYISASLLFFHCRFENKSVPLSITAIKRQGAWKEGGKKMMKKKRSEKKWENSALHIHRCETYKIRKKEKTNRLDGDAKKALSLSHIFYFRLLSARLCLVVFSDDALLFLHMFTDALFCLRTISRSCSRRLFALLSPGSFPRFLRRWTEPGSR